LCVREFTATYCGRLPVGIVTEASVSASIAVTEFENSFATKTRRAAASIAMARRPLPVARAWVTAWGQAGLASAHAASAALQRRNRRDDIASTWSPTFVKGGEARASPPG